MDDALIEMMSNKYWTLELPRGPVWPAAFLYPPFGELLFSFFAYTKPKRILKLLFLVEYRFMAGLGAVLAYDLASPLGLGAHVACTLGST